MKKIIILVVFVVGIVPYADASSYGRTDHGPLERPVVVIFRGVMNAVGLPLEVIRTMIIEKENHPRLWLITFFPRLMTNALARAASAVNDVLIFPWVAPFTDDISPLTESMGLSEYPWQIE